MTKTNSEITREMYIAVQDIISLVYDVRNRMNMLEHEISNGDVKGDRFWQTRMDVFPMCRSEFRKVSSSLVGVHGMLGLLTLLDNSLSVPK